ncbi:hypothetical protein Y032_0049g1861 [Ancylostoma ceylanicum]|uniref:F-box domain-containing protein n=2 Tax=Ancylostoma ceylanicum TaxID=53326 RepID=A0A016UAQ7_9BILA|nr:hypothetical protein Y032_0049g1861 [Ancylostoma ceylanicum]
MLFIPSMFAGNFCTYKYMDTLNRDCLSQIFLNLDFIERVRLEHVCRMFYYVLHQQSTFCDNVKLDISQFLINTSTDYYQQDSLSFLPTVVGVIERCGRYVQQLSFGQRWLRISQPIIDCIADNCNRLCVVDLGAVILSADLSPLLERIAPQLQEFSLEETSWVNIQCAEKVQNYFKDMKRLRKLNMRSAMFKLTKLADLSPTVRSIEIGGAHSFPSEVLIKFLQEHPDLEEFRASPAPMLDEDIITAIGSLENLRHLALGHSFNTDLQFDQLSNLTNLETLRLNDVFGLSEMSLRLILSPAQNLQQISLTNCKNILDYTALGCCGCLDSLEIRNTTQLGNEDLFTLCTYGNLKRLTITNCFNVSTRGVNIALMRCQLKELTINKCGLVTDEMMYTLASTQRELETISIQECASITSKGVSALAWLRNVHLLREVDVSRNRNVDDTVVRNLHTALVTSAKRRSPEPLLSKTEVKEKPQKRLIMYIFDTSISREVEQEVKDWITLC